MAAGRSGYWAFSFFQTSTSSGLGTSSFRQTEQSPSRCEHFVQICLLPATRPFSPSAQVLDSIFGQTRSIPVMETTPGLFVRACLHAACTGMFETPIFVFENNEAYPPVWTSAITIVLLCEKSIAENFMV